MERHNRGKFSTWMQWIRDQLRWLSPGLGIKRWLAVILLGTTLLGLGLAVVVLDVYRTAPDTWWLPVLSALSLRFLARPLRALIFGGFGLALILMGTAGMSRALLLPFVSPGKAVLDTVAAYRRKEKGPRIVAIGGGNGLSSLLRGLKEYSHNITAVVTVADDGGSSGELRRTMGILPPGDIRNCLTALSTDETMLSQIFQYRFGEGAGLNGHSLGNLFITALTDITGSFEDAVAESGRVLAVHGRVLPSTLHDVSLVADVKLPDEIRKIRVKGESRIPQQGGKIQRVWLEPDNPAAYPPAIQAILSADLIVVGPGSLYTSILPNLLVPDLAHAFKASRAMKFFVCNVAAQDGETEGYTCGDHVHTLEQHLGEHVFDLVVCNNHYNNEHDSLIRWVELEQDLDQHYALYCSNLLDDEHPWRHDSKKLAAAIMDLFYEKTGPLILKEIV